MNGIRIVLPNDSTMPAFKAGLAEAARAGVEINSLTCRVEADRIMITGCANDAARYQEP
jgi:DNA-binding sugar fermentation-stimulating protein